MPRQGFEELHHSASFRQSDQLLVCYGGCAKGRAVSKQRLSLWIVDAITAAHTSRGLECPLHIRAHSTRAIASSWVWSRGMSIRDICVAAGGWSFSEYLRQVLQAGCPVLSLLSLDDYWLTSTYQLRARLTSVAIGGKCVCAYSIFAECITVQAAHTLSHGRIEYRSHNGEFSVMSRSRSQVTEVTTVI